MLLALDVLSVLSAVDRLVAILKFLDYRLSIIGIRANTSFASRNEPLSIATSDIVLCRFLRRIGKYLIRLAHLYHVA